MLFRKLFPASVTKQLLFSASSLHQMAPVTRNQKISTSVNVANSNNSNKKVEKKLTSSKARNDNLNSQPVFNDKQTGKDGLPIIPFATQNDLEDWLRTNHTVNTGVWVKIAKKASGIPTVTYEQMLDAALCFGWIDGQRCSLDETWFLQRITRRRPKSNWSQVNREKVKRLIRMGKMQSAGQSLIDEAKADGRWDNAYKPPSGVVVPDELVAALEASSSTANDFFRTLSKSAKLVLIERVQQATSEDERNECLRTIVSMLEGGETLTESS